MVKKKTINEIITLLFMNIGILLYYYKNPIYGSILFFISLLYQLIVNGIKKEEFINPKNVFTYIFFFSIALSMLQLHHYQAIWDIKTFIILELSYIFFTIGYYLKSKNKNKEVEDNLTLKKTLSIANIIFYGSLICFFIEVLIEKNIPLFSSSMSSYHEFGVSGIHYFTCSSVLFSPIAYILLYRNND